MGWKSAAVWGLCLALLCAGVGASDSSANWIKVPEAATAQVIQVEEGTVEAGESLRVTVSVPEAECTTCSLLTNLSRQVPLNLVLAEVAGEEVRAGCLSYGKTSLGMCGLTAMAMRFPRTAAGCQ